MTTIQSFKHILIISIALFVLASYQFIGAAWTNPPVSPPAGNVDAPINVGSVNQIKIADITAVNLKAGSQMWSPAYCDEAGANCWDPASETTELPICTEGQTILFSGGAWICHTDDDTAPPPPPPPPPAPLELAFGVHNADQCTAAGGSVVNVGATHVCRFNGASCPSGWRQYQNWSTVTNKTCTPRYGSCNARSCSVGHSWANKSNSCSYNNGSRRNSDGCDNPSGSPATCTSSITRIGCY